MENLVAEYSKQMDSDLSLFIRSTSIVSKKSLEISDILDRGIPLVKQPVGQFRLDMGLLLKTERTIKDMQELLTKALSLVPGCTSTFTVDPHCILMTVLRSANELDKLHAMRLALGE